MKHAAVAKLNQYYGDTYCEQVLLQIDAAQEEGDTSFEVDISRVDHEFVMDLKMALEALGYTYSAEGDSYLEVFYE